MADQIRPAFDNIMFMNHSSVRRVNGSDDLIQSHEWELGISVVARYQEQ